MRRAHCAWAAALLLATLPGAAGGCRWGTVRVRIAAAASDVVARCGEPSQVTSRSVLRPPMVWRYGRQVRAAGGDIEVRVETWVYNFGPDRLMQQLDVEDGRVTKMETLGYGHR
jgi:hypothetical protein